MTYDRHLLLLAPSVDAGRADAALVAVVGGAPGNFSRWVLDQSTGVETHRWCSVRVTPDQAVALAVAWGRSEPQWQWSRLKDDTGQGKDSVEFLNKWGLRRETDYERVNRLGF